MRPHLATTIATYSVLCLAGGLTLTLPDRLIDSAEARPAAPPDVIRLDGVVRDFQTATPDFNVTSASAPGQYTGLVSTQIGADGLPTYTGSGNAVVTGAHDAAGNNIAPILANTSATLPVSFAIGGGKVTLSQPGYAMVSVLGAAMQNPYLTMAVTVRVKIGATTVEPWGSFNSATAGNVHDNNNPRNYTPSGALANGTQISVTGRSYYKNGGTWYTLQTVDSATGSTWVKVLRNGDSVPNIAPFASQASITSFLNGYVNTTTKKVTLASNQAIFLFELATTDPASPFVDYQDLVVLVTMATTPSALPAAPAPPPPPAPSCGPTNDTAAVLGAASTGAISSPASFKSWFSDKLGTNMSGTAGLDLVRQSNNNYLFDSATDPYYSSIGGFYPADGRLYGDVGSNGHNDQFTFHFEAMFTYDALANQFFDTIADAEVWVFINDKLVIDTSGIHGALQQRVDLSRLCLTNGQSYKLSFFMAHRYGSQSRLRIETNLQFAGSRPAVAVTGAFD